MASTGGAILDLTPRTSRTWLFNQSRARPVLGVFGSTSGGKVTLSIAVSDDVVGVNFNAGNLVRELAAHIGGSGGGQHSLPQMEATTPTDCRRHRRTRRSRVDIDKKAPCSLFHAADVRLVRGSRGHRHIMAGTLRRLGEISIHWALVLFLLAQTEVQNVEHIEHACQGVVECA